MVHDYRRAVSKPAMSINGRPLRRRPTGQHCRTGHNRSKLKIQFRLFHGALHSQCCTLPPPPGKCFSCHRQGGMAALYPFFFLLLMLCTVGPKYLMVGSMAIWYCTAFPLLLCGTASIVSYCRHAMALYRLTPMVH